MNRTKIPWCDWTWNPIVGCSPASEGCANCYAAAISRRFHLPWGSAHLMPTRLYQPTLLMKPGRVFVCSMADLGHKTVRPEWRSALYGVMREASWHTYIILTKRPGPWMSEIPARCWVGVSTENQEQADSRWQSLGFYSRRCGVKFVSVEPMLGPVTFAMWNKRPDWVIAGPETGPRSRPCEDSWINALAAESPCFFDKRAKWTRREFPNGNG